MTTSRKFWMLMVLCMTATCCLAQNSNVQGDDADWKHKHKNPKNEQHQKQEQDQHQKQQQNQNQQQQNNDQQQASVSNTDNEVNQAPPAIAPVVIPSDCHYGIGIGGSGTRGAAAFGIPLTDHDCKAEQLAALLYSISGDATIPIEMLCDLKAAKKIPNCADRILAFMKAKQEEQRGAAREAAKAAAMTSQAPPPSFPPIQVTVNIPSIPVTVQPPLATPPAPAAPEKPKVSTATKPKKPKAPLDPCIEQCRDKSKTPLPEK